MPMMLVEGPNVTQWHCRIHVQMKASDRPCPSRLDRNQLFGLGSRHSRENPVDPRFDLGREPMCPSSDLMQRGVEHLQVGNLVWAFNNQGCLFHDYFRPHCPQRVSCCGPAVAVMWATH